MKRFFVFWIGLCWAAAWVGPAWADAFHRPVNHKLSVTLDPDKRHAQVDDTVTLYPNSYTSETLTFLLHADYRIGKVGIPHQGAWETTIEKTEEAAGTAPPLQRIIIRKPADKPWPHFLQVVFRYQGAYYDPLRAGSAQPRGPDAPEPDTGIFLSGESYFYPHVDMEPGEAPLLTFALGVATPRTLKVISQGKRIRETTQNGPRHTLWQCDDPMEEIFIVADRFFEYKDRYEDVQLYVFLRERDEELAGRYLEKARSYLAFYSRLVGDYPFVKFAVVENSVETGYGMPSFTLLGSRVMRFPFIMNSSYPHEILHNWWGNSVYVDAEGGNWSEGLTAYMSDHLFMQMAGKGPEYRFEQLVKYRNYVNTHNEMAIADFTSRHDMASQAIGYGKLLMVLNMLRLEVGDKTFWQALGDFYYSQKFRRAGFRQLRAHFELFHGESLETFFRQWIGMKGAPELELSSITKEVFPEGYRLTLEIRQNQERPLYAFSVPVAVWYEGADEPVIDTVRLESKPVQYVKVFVPGEPQAVRVDPYHDVFRKLDRKEVPASIGQTYGAGKSVAVMPSQSTRALIEGFHGFARSLPTLQDMVLDRVYEYKSDPAAVWVFGKDNRAAEALKPQLRDYGVFVQENGVLVDQRFFPFENHSFVFTVPNPGHPDHSVTWVMTDSAESLPGLMRKLPHYGKYGYLVFQGSAPTNLIKGVWKSQSSPLLKTLYVGDYSAPPRPPLLDFRPE